jgi:hypothetical protein
MQKQGTRPPRKKAPGRKLVKTRGTGAATKGTKHGKTA